MGTQEETRMSLFDAIIRRRSHRGLFQDKPIVHGDLEQLLEAARWAPSPFNVQPWEFLIVREREGKIALAILTKTSIAEQLKDAKFLDDNSRWARLTDEEWKVRRDGILLADYVDLPRILSNKPNTIDSLLKNAKHLSILGRIGLGRLVAKKMSDLVRTSPLLILVLMYSERRPPGKGATRWMWLGMGAMIQNLLLTAVTLRIGAQFVSAPLEREADRERIREIFDIPDSIEIVSLLRLGYADASDEKSVRLRTSDFSQFEKYTPYGRPVDES